MKYYRPVHGASLGLVSRDPLLHHNGAKRTCVRCGRDTSVKDSSRPAVCRDCKGADPWFDKTVRLGMAMSAPVTEE